MLNTYDWMFEVLKNKIREENTNAVVFPCVHGNLCRQYVREGHGILRETCPRCEFYEPKVDKCGNCR